MGYQFLILIYLILISLISRYLGQLTNPCVLTENLPFSLPVNSAFLLAPF